MGGVAGHSWTRQWQLQFGDRQRGVGAQTHGIGRAHRHRECKRRKKRSEALALAHMPTPGPLHRRCSLPGTRTLHGVVRWHRLRPHFIQIPASFPHFRRVILRPPYLESGCPLSHPTSLWLYFLSECMSLPVTSMSCAFTYLFAVSLPTPGQDAQVRTWPVSSAPHHQGSVGRIVRLVNVGGGSG